MMQTIYDRIEVLIDSRNMTKKAFCEDLNISTGNFGDWKRGHSIPSAKKLIEIAQYFDVSLDWLMTGKERSIDGLKEREADYFFICRGNLIAIRKPYPIWKRPLLRSTSSLRNIGSRREYR